MIELEKSRDHYVDFYDCTPPLLSHSRALLAPVRPVCHQARPLPSGQDPTIPRSFWAGAYYQQQRKKGCSHQVAVRALAFKWIRIIYRCWKTRTPYDESVYLKALKKRGSPLLVNLTESAKMT